MRISIEIHEEVFNRIAHHAHREDKAISDFINVILTDAVIKADENEG